MAHLGNTVVNGALRVLGGEYVDSINTGSSLTIGALEVKGIIAGDSGSTGHGLYGGGGYHNAYNNILLHGDSSTATSGIAFMSDKVDSSGTVTNVNQPSDRAFIQYHACGITTATAEGTNPTLATSGENGRLVIGIGNDATDQVWLQTPGRTGLIHQVGNTSYVIPDTNNTTGSVGSATQPSYVEGGVIKACTYSLNKTVPADAVFTDNDTKNTAGSTDSSSKLFLIGATSQAANPQTYSHDTAYVGTDGCLYSGGTKVLTGHQTIKQDGVTGATVNRFGTCSTAAGTAAKEVSITTGTFSLEAGATIAVKFSNANTAGTPTLNVNSKGAKNIFVNGAQITTGGNKSLLTGTVIFVYDGTQWHLIGNYYDTNTQAVTGVKGNSESSYRTGNVNITAANVGAATSDHTHTTTIAADSGTSALNMAANTTYKLTAGGSTFIFKTPADSDTKNTAGSTDTSSKIFLVGATSQAANPQTYSDDQVYATSGTLTSNKVDTKAIVALAPTGTSGSDAGSGTSPRYKPAQWVANAGLNVANGEVYFVKVPNVTNSYGIWLSLNNGTNYYPIAISNGTGYCTTHVPVNSVAALAFESAGKCKCYAMAGADATAEVTGCFRVIDSYDSNTTYSAMSSSELTTGTATTSRVVRSDYLKTGINSLIDTKIQALDVTTSGAGASKTLTALSETDGKISATFGNISITKSQVSDFPTSMTPTSHTHGNIQNGGTLQTTDITIASGDKLIVTDSSDSSKIARTSISFDGSTATKALTQKGTWETFSASDTKNTAGSTDTSSKIFLVGATSQADNPQTYSHDTAYVGTDGCLYSGGTKVLTAHQTIKQDGITGATVNRFGTCSTAAGTAAKTVDITTGTFALEAGSTVAVKFTNANTANSPTLNVNSKGAKNIFVNGAQITSGGNKALLTGTVIFVYDGTQWNLVGNYYDTNTQTVTGVKGNSESSYRTGNVNITCANIGAATSDHTHTATIAADSGTNQLTMAANTKYKLTAGGSTFVFTTPPDNNTWTALVGATSSANGSVGYINATPPKDGYNTKYFRADGTWTVPPDNDTKNTAGSTDTSSKIFLIGATSQAANPQTYSHDTAYVGTDGCLYSGGTKVLTAHQDISGKVNKSGDTMTGRLTTTKPINQIITGSGTTAQDKGSGVSPRYFPAKWTFNTGQTVTNGDIITIKIPCAGHDYGVFISIDNGTTYKPVSTSGTSRLTTHYGNASYLTLIYKSDGGTNQVFAANGADARSNITGGCWLVCNYYDTGNTYDRNRYNAAIKAWGTKIVAGNIIVGINGLYHHLKEGTAFDITYPILYLNGDCNASSTTTNTYDILNFTITTTQSITLTAYKPVYIKGTLSGTTFTPDSTTPLTQTVPTSADGKYYMFLGNATSTTAVYLTERHEIYAYKNGAFGQIVNDALSVNGYTVAKSVPSDAVFTDNNNRKAFFCTCNTAAATAAKVVTPSDTAGWELKAGTVIGVKCTNGNTASNVTLNVNGSGAKSIWYENAAFTGTTQFITGTANKVIYYMYDGTYWVWAGVSWHSDVSVTQTATTTSADYEVLFSSTADNTTRTEGTRKNSNLKFNPSTGNLTVTKVNGEAVKYSSSVSAVVGDTTCIINDSSITTTSLIEAFSSNNSDTAISLDSIVVSTGKATLNFGELAEDTDFKVRITNV